MSNKKKDKDVDIHDLLTTKGLDEMQLSEMYKIAYNCFRAFFYINYAISFAMALISAGFENLSFGIASVIIALATAIIFIIFVVMLAKKGIMPPEFANKGGSTKKIIGSIFLVVYVAIPFISNVYEDGVLKLFIFPPIIFLITFIITYLLTRKNNKVVKQQESEEE